MSRALVLSGGGPVGIGWEAGFCTSLLEAGVQLGDADLIVGTSAGSVVGSQIAMGDDPADHISRMRERSDDAAPDGGAADIGARMMKLMEAMAAAAEAPPDERLLVLSKFVLEAETPPEDAFVASFENLLGAPWPDRFVCTAIDATDGKFVVWDANSGVDVQHAVASSCAVPCVFPAISIDGRPHFDGGMRSITNADIAKGHDKVLIASVFAAPPESTDPRAVRMRQVMEAEWKAIRDAGGEVEFVSPDAQARDVIGVNVMDPSKALEAFDAGVAQGQRDAARIGSFWT